MPHRRPVTAKSIPEVHLTAPGTPRAVPAADKELERNQRPRSAGDAGQSRSLAVGDGGIHVYAHQMSERTIRAVHAGSEEVGEALRSRSSPRVALGRVGLTFASLQKQQRERQLRAGVSVNPMGSFCWC